MDQVEAMRVYVRVAELASFTQAAQVLGLPKASVSTAVQRLEAQMGTQLLQRTTRRVHMTPDGQLYLDRCRELLADLEELQQLFRPEAAGLQGRLRVAVSSGPAHALVVPRLPEFLARHPGLHVELGSAEGRASRAGEGPDCVLRVGPVEDAGLLVRPLGHLAQLNCASPAYLAAFGTPRTLQELQRHRLVHHAPVPGARSPGFEYVDAVTGETCGLPMAGSLTVNDAQAQEAACLAGLGLIQAPELALRAHVQAGRLVELLPEWRAAPRPVTLLYASRRQGARRVQAFMAWLEDLLQPWLLEPAWG